MHWPSKRRGGNSIGLQVTNEMPRSCSLAIRAYSNATRPWEISMISMLTRTKRVSTRQAPCIVQGTLKVPHNSLHKQLNEQSLPPVDYKALYVFNKKKVNIFKVEGQTGSQNV